MTIDVVVSEVRDIDVSIKDIKKDTPVNIGELDDTDVSVNVNMFQR